MLQAPRASCRGGGTVDARDLKSRDFGRMGSNPIPGTNSRMTRLAPAGYG